VCAKVDNYSELHLAEVVVFADVINNYRV